MNLYLTAGSQECLELPNYSQFMSLAKKGFKKYGFVDEIVYWICSYQSELNK